jgi:hypothetical protein
MSAFKKTGDYPWIRLYFPVITIPAIDKIGFKHERIIFIVLVFCKQKHLFRGAIL